MEFSIPSIGSSGLGKSFPALFIKISIPLGKSFFIFSANSTTVD